MDEFDPTAGSSSEAPHSFASLPSPPFNLADLTPSLEFAPDACNLPLLAQPFTQAVNDASFDFHFAYPFLPEIPSHHRQISLEQDVRVDAAQASGSAGRLTLDTSTHLEPYPISELPHLPHTVPHPPSPSCFKLPPLPVSVGGSNISTPTPSSRFGSTQLTSRQRASQVSVETVEWRINEANGYWEVLCPRCDEWISTGSCKVRNLQPLKAHLARKRDCKLQDPRHARIFPPNQHPYQGSIMTSLPLLDVDIQTPSKFISHCYTWDSDSEEGGDDTAEPLPVPDFDLRPPTAASSPVCPGIPLDWPLANFWSTYPFQRHDDPSCSLGYYFIQFRERGSQPWVRANICTGVALSDGSACIECQSVRRKRDHLAELARHALPGTSNKLRTHKQLCEQIHQMADSLQTWKMKTMNLNRRHSLLMSKLDDHRRLVMAVAENKIPRVQQLLRQGVKAGTSVSKIVAKLEDSLCGVYQARKYDSDDYDLSLLILRLGGRKLLYAMSQQIAVPSIRTLRRHSTFTKLIPSLGAPSLEDITGNISAIFDSRVGSIDESGQRPFVSGVCVQWDEISIEEVVDWFPHSDMVGGLCREHSSNIDISLATFDHALSIAKALHDGVVHRGKEASVVAVASFGVALRGVFPILVSPTCKAESPSDSAALLRKVFQAWKESAASRFGPIWSFASDGDAGRRAMVYQLFMKHTIDHRHRLFKYVGRLSGFNCEVGDDDITGDFDWKHELKRAGRLLRTLEGVTIGRTVVNFETIRRHLRRDPDLSEADIDRLTNPSDTQDVPRAIEFLEAVNRISELPIEGCTPVELQELPPITVVAEMFMAFMDAFIAVDWNLSQQLISLSKFAHTAFVLFRQHGVNFMPNQLYGDMQTTVKNIIICIAKQLDLDRSQPFYLFWAGDDRTENMFGRVRMLGGHSPNFSYKNLLDRLGVTVDLAAVFSRQPHLDSGFRRLKVSRTEHIDHLNPESWRGRAIVGDVDLLSTWMQGRAEACTLLRRVHIDFDFETAFASNSMLDMLRPYGNGVYPGVATDSPDRSEDPTTPLSSAAAASTSVAPTDGDSNTQTTPLPRFEPEANPELITIDGSSFPSPLSNQTQVPDTTELHIDSDLPASVATLPSPIHETSCNTDSNLNATPTEVFELTEQQCDEMLQSTDICSLSTGAEDGLVTVEGSDLDSHAIDLEDLLEEPNAAPNSLLMPTTGHGSGATGSKPEYSPWIEHNGRKIHKATICRLVITPDYVRKSHERLLRVRGYSAETKRRNLSSDDITDSEAFFTSDLFATLLRCDNIITLAILKCLAIEEKGLRVERTRREHLSHAAAGIRLTGQILSLRPLSPTTRPIGPEGSSASLTERTEPSSPSESDQLWVWNGDFAQLQLSKAQPSATAKSARKTIAIRIASHVCSAVNAQVVNIHEIPETVDAADFSQLNSAGLTWGFMDAELTALVTKLWNTVSTQKLLSIVPVFRTNADVPYRSLSGEYAFVSVEGSATIANAAGNAGSEGTQCYQCGKKLKKGEARNHVGGHILKAMRGVHENLPGQPVGKAMPCGFCGLSNIADCQQLYITKHGYGQAKSNCSHAHEFQYKASLISTLSTPCTNTPVVCPIRGCAGEVGSNKTAIWKYNMPEHIRIHHPGYSCDGIEDGLPDDKLLTTILITAEEESRLGIPNDKIPPKVKLTAPAFSTAEESGQRRGRGKRTTTKNPITSSHPPSKRRRAS
ncbi:hypothetical protein BC629DRAFT_1713564 [Irpex lacteus]|nr:hypothetical protein BC629DRAFT_1713564 [Irpex lacteus]